MMRAFASLSNRIFFASALLAALSIGAATFFVRVRLTSETQQALARDLETAASIADHQQAALFETFSRSARLVADLPRFKAAVDTGDPPTVQPVAEDYLRQLGADRLEVHDRRGRRLAAAGDRAAGVLRVIEVPIQVGPDTLGRLTVGYQLDEARAMELRALTGAEIAFANRDGVHASTLGTATFDVFSGLPLGAPARTISVGETEFVAVARPLHPEMNGATASVIVMHSRTERMRTLAAIETFLVGLALGSVLLASAFSYWVARTVTRPLASIADHMRQVAASGDLTRKLPVDGDKAWYDEDAQVLARTFNALTDAVTRFQGEAAQRERLSALGRLSTVVAHEIRNPLMIIKGALRTVTREGATTEDLRDAAADIDGEIARLNHLVHDVLDFAAPIRFDCTPTDLNAVCENAVKAVSVNGRVRPGLALSPLPTVITDGERIRMVLVNLITNAQHAVDGTSADDDTPPIVVTSTALSPDRVAIAVHDRGAGIPADDLPRIFDPYFTTRRGGTGLGLAISKNIIDGLAGSITVTSRPGAGTEFRIEIGHAPHAAR